MQIDHNKFAMMAHKLGGGARNQRKNKNWQPQRETSYVANHIFSSNNNSGNGFSHTTGHVPINWKQQRFNSPPNPKYHSGNRNGNFGSSNNEQSFTNTERVPAWANSPTFDPYVCQICGKRNHMALDCFHRYDYNYQGRHPP